jgi:GNAT superfamily N-acetyltransferase
MFGETPPPRTLNDLTNTPSPVHFRASVPPATSVQRFLLRSRRAARVSHPYGGTGIAEAAAAYPLLKMPPGVACCSTEDLVRICPCSWQRALAPGRQRLCQRDTEEHPEFRLLETMGRRFRQEIGALPMAVGTPSIAGRASLQHLEVHFILQPDGRSDTVVGYVALSSEGDAHDRPLGLVRAPGGTSFLEFVQLYVEPEFRRRGVATAALGVLLARHKALLVDSRGDGADNLPRAAAGSAAGLAAVARLLARLGFRQELFGAEAGIATGYTLYRRQGLQYISNENENVRRAF